MGMRFFYVVTMLALVCAVSGCQKKDHDDGWDEFCCDDDYGDDEEEPIDIEWRTCSLVDGADDGLAECGTARVPLNWEDPDDNRAITVGAMRLLSNAKLGGINKAIWLIQGGPGASGTLTFGPLMLELQKTLPDWDFYTIDHRGVGASSALHCPDQEAESSEGGAYISSMDEWDACLDWLDVNLGDRLQAYSTRNAAHDLAAFIDATRGIDGGQAFVWGGSYGTYLTERYLLLHPDQANGAILDSIHALSVPSYNFAPAYQANGKRLLAACADDPFCAAKFSDDPWTVLENLYTKLEGGHCAALGIDHYTLAYLLGWLAWYSPYNAAAPAMIYRLDRCDPADMDAIVYMYYNLFNGSGDLLGLDGEWFSQVLNANIGMSDQFWGPGLDSLDVDAFLAEWNEKMLFGTAPTEFEFLLYDKWPRYDEPRMRDLPVTETPVLMLQGDLDGATPLEVALPLKDALDGERQFWVQFPYSAHGVLNDSWISSDPDEPTCGLSIMAEFMNSPYKMPETGCVADTIPTPFEGYPALAQAVFGTDDLWENPAKSAKSGHLIRPVRLEAPALPLPFEPLPIPR